MALRVYVVEPFYGGSHRAWADGLQRHSRHELHLVAHEDAFWRWRMQGGAVSLASALVEEVRRHGPPDVLLVSTMVDLPALLGLARRTVRDVPVVHYVHENQLTHPRPPGEPLDRSLALVGWKGLVAADRVVFNSAFHRTQLLEALPSFLGSFPDHRHADLVPAVATKSVVLPVGIELERLHGDERAGDHPPGRAEGRRRGVEPPLVLWNQRWAFDKDPEALFAALGRLDDRGVPFRLALAGERPPTVPPSFASARERYGDRLEAFGDVDEEDYPSLLQRSDLVVSTARHEFFGIAVVEAMAAAACPVLPDRLSYPEVLADDELRAACLYQGADELADRLELLLSDATRRRALGLRAAATMARFDWAVVAPAYDRLLAEVAAGEG